MGSARQYLVLGESYQERRFWRELLPGIAEFLSETLAKEHLSLAAEERRQFFLERLDIIQLPPSLPPREGRMLSPQLLKETEETSGVPSLLSCSTSHNTNGICTDFAATQRQISRAAAEGSDGSVGEVLGAKIKLYDDIDLPKSLDGSANGDSDNHEYQDSEVTTAARCNNKPLNDQLEKDGLSHQDENEDDGEDDDDDNGHYEIPVARQQLPPSPHDDHPSETFAPTSPAKSLPDGRTASVASASESVEELFAAAVLDGGVFCDPPPPPIPPPLPPRREANLRWSDPEARSAVTSLFTNSSSSGSGGRDGGDSGGSVPPELPFRPPQLPRRGEFTFGAGFGYSEDHSDVDISGDGDSTSYESFDEDFETHEGVKKFGIKLPQKAEKKPALGVNKKRTVGLTGGNRGKTLAALKSSRTSSHFEVSVPFRQLDNVDISGELYHRGKLSWSRRLVALSCGCLALYKPDKDGARPCLVVPLPGYTATVGEREGRRGFEIRLTHPADDTHTFAVDFRDWASLWAEHVNGHARGQPPPKYHTHLARSFNGGEFGTQPQTGSKHQTTSKLSTSGDTEYDIVGSPQNETLLNGSSYQNDKAPTNTKKEKKSKQDNQKASALPSRLYRGNTLGSKRAPKAQLLPRGKTLDVFPTVTTYSSTSMTPSSSTTSLSSSKTTAASKDGGHGKGIGAAVKDILARRQRGLFKVTTDTHAWSDNSSGVSNIGVYNRRRSRSGSVETTSEGPSGGSLTPTAGGTGFRLMPSSDLAKGAAQQLQQPRRPPVQKAGAGCKESALNASSHSDSDRHDDGGCAGGGPGGSGSADRTSTGSNFSNDAASGGGSGGAGGSSSGGCNGPVDDNDGEASVDGGKSCDDNDGVDATPNDDNSDSSISYSNTADYEEYSLDNHCKIFEATFNGDENHDDTRQRTENDVDGDDTDNEETLKETDIETCQTVANIYRGDSNSRYGDHVLTSKTKFTLGRFDWKSMLMSWTAPIDQLLMTLRMTDLSASASNLSTGSEGTGDEASKAKFKNNKVMRMGSFAFRATQFFETFGKKATLKRKSSSNSSKTGNSNAISNGNGSNVNGDSNVGPLQRRRQQLLSSTASSSSQGELCNGIAEEASSLPSSPLSLNGNNQSFIVPPPVGSDSGLPPVFSSPVTPSGTLPNKQDLGDKGFFNLHSGRPASFSGTPANRGDSLDLDSRRDLGRSIDGRQSKGQGALSLAQTNRETIMNQFSDAIHKGYLSVFSSFNRRRWGQRLCVVRANMFECYQRKGSRSGSVSSPGETEICWDTCELSFLLRPCELKPAVEETGSELGLMLQEKGRERITVEALSEQEMVLWVRVLLTETSTPEVPEGLKKYLGHWECAEHDGGSVLQQWGLNNLEADTNHQYEDPHDTVVTGMGYGISPKNAIDTGDRTIIHTTSASGHAEILEATKNKDSQCFSREASNNDGTGSDSRDAGVGDEIDVEDGGYAMLSTDPKIDNGVCRSRELGQSTEEGDSLSALPQDTVDKLSGLTSSYNDSHSEDGSDNRPGAHSALNSCSHHSISIVPSQSPENISNEQICISKSDQENQLSLNGLSPTSPLSSSPSSSSSSTSLSRSNSTPPSSSVPSILTPTGEAYSLVIKRSDRLSLESYRSTTTTSRKSISSLNSSSNTLTSVSSSVSNNHSTSSIIEVTSQSQSPQPSFSNRGEVKANVSSFQTSKEEGELAEEEDDDNVFQNMMVVCTQSSPTPKIVSSDDGDATKTKAEMELALSLSCNNNTESYYEPIGLARHNMSKSECNKSPSRKSASESNFVQIPIISCGEADQEKHQGPNSMSTCDDTESAPDALNSSIESENDEMKPFRDVRQFQSSTGSISLVLDQVVDSGRLSGANTDDFDSSGAQSPAFPSQLVSHDLLESNSSQNSSCEVKDLPGTSDTLTTVIVEQEKSKDISVVSTEACHDDVFSIITIDAEEKFSSPEYKSDSQTNKVLSEEEKHSNFAELSTTSPSDILSQESDDQAMASKDLEQALEQLKDRQIQLKRKRMAVHDKRQRVNSDEERLVCEKEMAALERLGENTDTDIRIIQTQLAVLQGESLEVLCAASTTKIRQAQGHFQGQNQVQGKKSKCGSKKRKQKRKF